MDKEFEKKLGAIFAHTSYEVVSDKQIIVKGSIHQLHLDALGALCSFSVESTLDGLMLHIELPKDNQQKMLICIKDGHANVVIEGNGTVLVPRIAELLLHDRSLMELMDQALDYAKFRMIRPCNCAGCRAVRERKFNA